MSDKYLANNERKLAELVHLMFNISQFFSFPPEITVFLYLAGFAEGVI